LKYGIYLAVGALILWSVWYTIRHLIRRLQTPCAGCCSGC